MSSNKPPIRLGIVGVGKIVRDQHLPALARDKDYLLAAAASRNATVDGIANFSDIEEMLASGVEIDAVSLCQPPQVRHRAARVAVEAGKHVFLEKPPGATVSEVEDLKALAAQKGVSLFASWHSRYAPAVEAARAFLASTRIRSAAIDWREDVRRWHPNQDWIWRAGGFGVFDPGINALSIMAAILPAPLLLDAAQIDIPEGRGSPIAATMAMRSGDAEVTADLDFLQTGPQSWDIEVETDAGTLRLSMGGSVLELPGGEPVTREDREYPRLYTRFAELIAAGKSDVDIRPLQLVADAFLVAERRTVAPFQF